MDCSLAGCSVPVVSQLKSTGVGCHFLLQGIFPTQGSNPCLLHWQVNSWPLSYQCVCSVLSDSFATPRTIAHEVPLSMEFSRQEYCSGLPLPSPGDLPDPGIESGFPVLQADSLLTEPPGKTQHSQINLKSKTKPWVLEHLGLLVSIYGKLHDSSAISLYPENVILNTGSCRNARF